MLLFIIVKLNVGTEIYPQGLEAKLGSTNPFTISKNLNFEF
jgi:hypothetical protein